MIILHESPRLKPGLKIGRLMPLSDGYHAGSGALLSVGNIHAVMIVSTLPSLSSGFCLENQAA